jgi:5,10-methylenetetrahydromethanopterin reductase
VPDEVVERITASGTPEEARSKVAEYRKRGCTCPVLYSVGTNVGLLIETFAQA